MYALSGSFLAEGFIFTIDVFAEPGVIGDRLQVTSTSNSFDRLDLEDIAVDPNGHFWLRSEGRTGARPNAVLEVDPGTGAVISEYHLPPSLTNNQRNNGIEGIVVTGSAQAEMVYIAIQRA